MSDLDNSFVPNEAKIALNQFIQEVATLPIDPLADYSARDLISALHWTSKDKLKPSLYKPNEIDESWENLMKADKALHRFYAFELAEIIEAHKSRKGGNQL